jgi:hypothetical protein
MFPLISIIQQVENLSSFSCKNSPAFLNYTIIDELLKVYFDPKILISMDSTNIIEILATLFRQ